MNLELNHGEGNPRNSEGSFVELNDGRIMMIYTRYTGGDGWDHGEADLARCIFSPETKTWSAPEIVIKNKAMNVMSVSLLRLQSGKIGMVYLEKTRLGESEYVDCRPWFRFSEDEGETWSEPIAMTDVPHAYLVFANDRLVQLKSGRLIIPGAFYHYGWSYGILFCFLSDDEGHTWRRSMHYCYPPHWISSGLTEPGIVEREDGSLLMWARTNAGMQYRTFSYDGGEIWREAIPASQWMSPESPMNIKRNPWTGEMVAVWNDSDIWHGVIPEPCSWGRTPLVMAYSDGDGEYWHSHILVEDAPDRGFCYVGMLFPSWAKDHVFLAYCCGADNGVLNDLKVNYVELKKSDRRP